MPLGGGKRYLEGSTAGAFWALGMFCFLTQVDSVSENSWRCLLRVSALFAFVCCSVHSSMCMSHIGTVSLDEKTCIR